MEEKFFEPTKGADNLWRLRITSSEEDELGVLTQKTGFLAFRDSEKASKVYQMLTDNELAPVFGAKITGSTISEVTYKKVAVEVAPA